MEFRVESAKLTSSPNAYGWTQAYEFKSDDPLKFKERGEIFAVISTTTQKEGVDSVLAGREILTRLHEEYFGKLTERPLSALKSALEIVLREFSKWENIEIASCCLVGENLYLGVAGGGKISIFREGELATVLESSSESVVVASGNASEGDILVLGSGDFFGGLAKGVLKSVLSARDPQMAVESLTPVLHARGERGNLGAIVVKFSLKLAEEVYEEKVPTPEKFFSKPQQALDKLSGGSKDLGRSFRNALASFGKPSEKNLYIRGGDIDVDKRKKLTLSVGIFLLLILTISIFFGVRQKRIADYRSQYTKILSEAEHSLNEAGEVYSINPARARELFVDSQNKVLGLMDEGIDEPEVSELDQKILTLKSQILGEYTSEADLFVDLSLLSSGFSGESLSMSGGKAYVLDRDGKRIVGITVSNKGSRVVAGPSQIEKVDSISAFSDRVFILNADGVYEINQKKVVDREWGGDALFSVYAGNVYILDKVGSTIWRYPGTGSEFLERQNWIAEGNVFDFTSAYDFVINGSIWVLTPPRKISKFSLGNQINFSLTGVFPEVIKIDGIFVSDATESLYILEKDAKRIVVVTKDGNYVAQYVTDTIGETIDFVVSEEDKKIVLLTSDKLYSIELKHL